MSERKRLDKIYIPVVFYGEFVTVKRSLIRIKAYCVAVTGARGTGWSHVLTPPASVHGI